MIRKLTFLYNGKTFDLENIDMLTFVIENKKCLFDLELYIHLDFSCRNPFFSLIIDNEIVEITNYVEVIDNIFKLDLNSKRNINSLYKILKSFYKDNIKEGINEINKNMSHVIKEISTDFDLNLSFSEDIKEEDIFKMFELKFEDEENDIIKRIIKYINVSFELRKTTIFYFFHLHEYLEDYQIEILLKELLYKNVKIVDIEPNNSFVKCSNEQILIVDNDLCSL